MDSIRLRLRNIGWVVRLGSAVGALWLGLGGRVAMWVFAVATGRPPVVTLGGTLRVAFAGALFGALGGLLLALTARVLPAGALPRGVLFGAVFMALVSPGIVPHQPLTFAVFAPCFLLYGVTLAFLAGRPAAPAPGARPRLRRLLVRR